MSIRVDGPVYPVGEPQIYIVSPSAEATTALLMSVYCAPPILLTVRTVAWLIVTENKIKSILSAEQFEKWNTNKEKSKEKLKAKRAEKKE